MNMKNLSALLVSFFVSASMMGQIKLNPHIGLNSIVGDMTVEGTEFQGDVGLVAGVFVRVAEDNALFLLPGIQYYTYRHAVLDTSGPSNLEIGDTNLKYVKIPLNVAYTLTGKGGSVKLFVNGGFTPSFAISEPEDIVTDVLPNIRQKDFLLGGNLGIGLDVLMGTIWFNYETSATKIYEEADTSTSLFTLAAGIRF